MARFRPGAADVRRLADRFWSTSRINRVAILAGVLWSVLVLSYAGGYFGGTGGGQARGTAFLDAVFFLVALFLPLGLVALAAWLADELARQRAAVAALVEAAAPLAAALAETRRALSGDEGALAGRGAGTGGGAGGGTGAGAGTGARPRAAAAASGEAVAAAAEPASTSARLPAGRGEGPAAAPGGAAARALRRQPAGRAAAGGAVPGTAPGTAPRTAPEAGQPELPDLGAAPEEPLSWDDLLRALDFPRDQGDADGFAALERALRHRPLRQMLQAAEDVLNLLSQEGIFTDDLEHRPGPPEAWRAFVAGTRGAAVTAAGGIREPRALEAVRGLMKSDPIFRDAALVFQRRFDAVLAELAPGADDEALLALADTRSGRAFMLCARVSGSFG